MVGFPTELVATFELWQRANESENKYLKESWPHIVINVIITVCQSRVIMVSTSNNAFSGQVLDSHVLLCQITMAIHCLVNSVAF